MRCFAYCLLVLFAASCKADSKNNTKPPSPEFIRFCSEYISKNRNTDSSRLIKKNLYNELIYTSRQLFDKQPFYSVSFENSAIVRFFKNRSESEKEALFEKTTGAWGFFYFRQDGAQFPDGVVEEWSFESKEDAEDAWNAVKNSGDEIFFNTQPYFCLLKNNLYVFHTRAMAFSDDQKLLFGAFVKRTGANP
jgi:hypothetical protein